MTLTFKNHDKWKNQNYTAKSGDLIFFDWDGNDLPDHVGIVEKVENGKVYTIEGNSSDEVRLHSYFHNNRCIFGYGIVQ